MIIYEFVPPSGDSGNKVYFVSRQSGKTQIKNERSMYYAAPWIQKEKEMLAVEGDIFVEINTWMSALLDYLAQQHA